jgi:hypothetical protein
MRTRDVVAQAPEIRQGKFREQDRHSAEEAERSPCSARSILYAAHPGRSINIVSRIVSGVTAW